jgi:hypothetical protein
MQSGSWPSVASFWVGGRDRTHNSNGRPLFWIVTKLTALGFSLRIVQSSKDPRPCQDPLAKSRLKPAADKEFPDKRFSTPGALQ